MTTQQAGKQEKRQFFKGTFMALGVYVCYTFLNLFNERMHKYPYERVDKTRSDYFREQASMNCLTSLLCTIIGFVYNRLFPPKVKTSIPPQIIAKQSALMFTSSCLVNKSLNYVSFILLSMIKSCSMLSVVIVGVFFTRVKNDKNKMSSTKIIVATLIVSGTIIFQLTGIKTIEQSSTRNQIIGLSLLFVSIIADGLLPDFQARMKQLYTPTTMQLYEQSHRYVFLFAFIVSILSGGLFSTFSFWYSHPSIISHCLCYMLCGSLGHIFIFGLIKNFSQLMAPLVLSIRKMLSIVISIAWFGHELNIYQYLGIFLVFSGAMFQVLYKPKPKSQQSISNHNKLK